MTMYWRGRDKRPGRGVDLDAPGALWIELERINPS
jgi:hypothetical protein